MHQGTDSNDYFIQNEQHPSFNPSGLMHQMKTMRELQQDIKTNIITGDVDFIENSKSSSRISYDTDFNHYDLDISELPTFVLPTHNLAIREEGLIPKSALVAIAGAIIKVNVTMPSDEAATTFKRKHLNEATHYQVDADTCKSLFSKSTIKQLLLLHMLPIGNDGSLLNVSFKKIADYLNVSIRTVKNNLATLAEHNFISYSVERKKYFDFTLLHYASKHIERGYVKFSKTTFEKFIAIQDVNALRLGLRMYQRTIEELAKRKNNYRHNVAPNFIIDEISSILPKYITHPKAIKNLTALLSDIFENSILLEDDLFFVLSHNNTPEVHQESVMECVHKTIITLINHGLEVFDKKDKEDLIQLTNQYGINKTIHTIKTNFFNTNTIDFLNKGELSFGMILRNSLRLENTSVISKNTVFSAN